MNNKEILIISYQFPPDTGSIQRVINIVKYLPEYGYKITILTHNSNDYESCIIDKKYDESGIKVVRTKSILRYLKLNKQVKKNQDRKIDNKISLNRTNKVLCRKLKKVFKYIINFFIWPDNKVFWIFIAFFSSLNLIKRNNINIVYIVTPPHSSSIIGYFLKKIKKIKLILDFRDPWANDVDLFVPSPFHKKCHEFAESRIINASNLVITTTEYHTDYFIGKISGIKTPKIFTISNGIDLDIVPKYLNIEVTDFTITYVGNFDSTRNPFSFFKALSKVIKNHPHILGKNSVRFFGRYNTSIEENIKQFELNDIVLQYGYIDYLETFEETSKSALLLLIIHNDFNTPKYSIPAKLYEYIAVGRPILAITPEGAASKIINDYKLGWCFDHSDIKGIEEKIIECYNNFISSNLNITPLDSNCLNQYDRKILVRKLATILDNL